MKSSIKEITHNIKFRLSRSKVWKLTKRAFSPSSKFKWLTLIKKAQAACQDCTGLNYTRFVEKGKCFFLPEFRFDGVGMQALNRILVMFLSQKSNATYIHVPFLNIAHKNVDPIGRSFSQEKWDAKFESFFNLGRNEFSIIDLANDIGEDKLAEYFTEKGYHLFDQVGQYDKKDDAHRTIPLDLIEKIQDGDNVFDEMYILKSKVCKQLLLKNKFFVDEDFIDLIQKKFDSNGFRPRDEIYSSEYLDIAIHIRRGDVWEASQTGIDYYQMFQRLVSEEEYVELIARLQALFEMSSKPPRFHIFSDGQQENFRKFIFTEGSKASLKLESGTTIENIQFHLCQNTFDTLFHMINAPILIPGKSAFSCLAVLLGKSYVFYDERISDFLHFDVFGEYIEGSHRFVSLMDLDDKVVDIVQSLECLRESNNVSNINSI